MSKTNVVCPSCGFDKNPPGSARCASCGSKIEALTKARRDDDPDRRYQQEGISIQWMAIALAVQGVLTAALVFMLPKLVTAIDLEGGNGMIMCVPVWFVGGILVGMISPGRTFIEPTIAAFLVALPTTFLLVQSQTVRTMPTFLYVIMSGIGILFTLIGSYIGERIQLGPPPKAAE
jgi:DNA-directed RNA polymerase subunit RPC12/RpoP